MDDKKVRIECVNITKKYNIYKGNFGKLKALLLPGYKGRQFTALEDVNMVCNEGEIVAFVGLNGSGKTTLSNIIAGLSYPDSGVLNVSGTASMLAAKVGLDRYLTGRENIALKSMLMGFSNKEIKEMEQSIIDFAEIGMFIDQPVRTYSSGMKARLGFGISVQMDTDVLIIDEALAVGDSSFVQKCRDKILEFKERNKTIIYVSHIAKEIYTLADKVLWLHKGRVIGFGATEEIITPYGYFSEDYGRMSTEEKDSFIPVLSNYSDRGAINE